MPYDQNDSYTIHVLRYYLHICLAWFLATSCLMTVATRCVEGATSEAVKEGMRALP